MNKFKILLSPLVLQIDIKNGGVLYLVALRMLRWNHVTEIEAIPCMWL